jgi:hypothetical protein
LRPPPVCALQSARAPSSGRSSILSAARSGALCFCRCRIRSRYRTLANEPIISKIYRDCFQSIIVFVTVLSENERQSCCSSYNHVLTLSVFHLYLLHPTILSYLLFYPPPSLFRQGRKRFLAHGMRVAGRVFVDAGAARAISSHSSLVWGCFLAALIFVSRHSDFVMSS